MVCYKENLHTILIGTMSQLKYAETYLTKRIKNEKVSMLSFGFFTYKPYFWQGIYGNGIG